MTLMQLSHPSFNELKHAAKHVSWLARTFWLPNTVISCVMHAFAQVDTYHSWLISL
jgi:hypothetical protein